ncbi:MAG: carbon-nitrogen hydrolase family protein, partial [Deltaproteobacteria bacterium]|nr:carbon-nitrogen hydrolase family protein [Deltaproteobacteria bacterium]
IERENSRYFNVCYYVDRTGQVKARYKKIHLWTTEAKYLSPGNEVCIFSTRFGKVGIGICWDLAFPEFFRALILNGAQIVVVPSYWTFGDPEHNFAASRKVMRSFVDSLCISRSFENEVVLIYCNAAGKLDVGDSHYETLVGHSKVATPILGTVKKLNHNNQALCLAEVDLKILNKAENMYRIKNSIAQSSFAKSLKKTR